MLFEIIGYSCDHLYPTEKHKGGYLLKVYCVYDLRDAVEVEHVRFGKGIEKLILFREDPDDLPTTHIGDIIQPVYNKYGRCVDIILKERSPE